MYCGVIIGKMLEAKMFTMNARQYFPETDFSCLNGYQQDRVNVIQKIYRKYTIYSFCISAKMGLLKITGPFQLKYKNYNKMRYYLIYCIYYLITYNSIHHRTKVLALFKIASALTAPSLFFYCFRATSVSKRLIDSSVPSTFLDIRLISSDTI